MENADILSFAMLIVTVVATVVAILSVVDARRSRADAAKEATRAESAAARSAAASEGIHAAMIEGAESERLVRRMEFARDLMVWLEKSTAIMVAGSDLSVLQRDWLDQGERLSATARTIDSEGGTELLIAAREARAGVERTPENRRILTALFMTRLLKMWVEEWVRDPKPVDYPVTSWLAQDDAIDAVAARVLGEPNDD